MATNFPGSLDAYVNPVGSDGLAAGAGGVSHANMHANLHDAVEAIEVKVGANGSTVTTSHDYKIAQLESGLSTAESDIDTLETNVSTLQTDVGTLQTDVTALENKDFTVTFGSGSDLDGSFTVTNLGNVTNTTVSVRDDSHNHIISNVDGLQTALDGKLDSTAKAADSDRLDNLDSTQFLRSDADDTGSGRVTLTRTGMGVDWTTAQLVLNPGSDAGIAIRTGNLDQYTVQLRAGGTGGTSIPRLYVTGDVGGGPSVVWSDIECRTVTENSARRFKDNIVSAYADTDSDAIEKVKQIPLSSFNYLDNPSETVVGVVAEDLIDVLPEAVVYRDDEVSSVVTQRITYTALGALKQAINKIEALEAQVASLQGA